MFGLAYCDSLDAYQSLWRFQDDNPDLIKSIGTWRRVYVNVWNGQYWSLGLLGNRDPAARV